MTGTKLLRSIRTMAGIGATVALCYAQAATSAPLDLAESPLFLSTGIAPNVILTLDDSTSMERTYAPDGGESNGQRSTATHGYKRWKSPDFNPLYYNPDFDYEAPKDEQGNPLTTSYANAYLNGYNTSLGSIDLRNNYRPWLHFNPDDATESSMPLIHPNIYEENPSDDFPGAERSGVGAYYYEYDDTLSGCSNSKTDDDCYSIVKLNDIADETRRTQQQENFAYWYSFYRSRNLATVTGANRALWSVDEGSIRLGWQALESCNRFADGSCDSYRNLNVDNRLGLFTGTHRQNFIQWLNSLPTDGSTPLRDAMQRAGEEYREAGPYKDPAYNDQGEELECQRNYHVLMTDGIWNDREFRDDYDDDNSSFTLGDGSTTYNGRAPYYSRYEDTIADMAFHYWATDLRPGLPNEVPTSMRNVDSERTDEENFWDPRNDPATWQHMVTYAVSLGLSGVLDSDGKEWGGSTFSGDYSRFADGTEQWLRAAPNTSPGNVYDLWHAAINGRGEFFSADDPKSLVTAFTEILDQINQRTASSSAVTVQSGSVSTNDAVYFARFGHGWAGELLAYNVNSDGDIGSTKWEASCILDGDDGCPDGGTHPGEDHDSRKIVTYDEDNEQGVVFDAANLPGSLSLSQEQIEYIRGNRAEEQKNDGSLRTRNSLLGDIVHSSPVYVGEPDRVYGFNSYESSHPGGSRDGMVYVGANDGMLHAFDAETGEEVFGFIPSAVHGKLAELTQPGYTHQYYVDGTPSVGDVYINTGAGEQWHTVLIGGLRGGGQGVYALDVTEPGSWNNESAVADSVLWEFTDEDDADLGYTYSQPQIVRVDDGSTDGKWVAIFGNGYNSSESDGNEGDGNAKLFMVDIATGNATKIDTGAGDAATPNGLATPLVADIDGDFFAEYAYAGDLQGNLWKFDLASNTSEKLFQANSDQPITTQPSIRRHPNGSGYMITFGTGKYLEPSDNSPSNTQSVYGIWDEDDGSLSSAIGRGDLVEQELDEDGDVRTLSDNPVDWSSDKGWYIDLDSGEIQVTDTVSRNGILLFTTMSPDGGACSMGGQSWLMAIDYATGAHLPFSPFDMNDDGVFDSDDYRNGEPLAGLLSPKGVLQAPTVQRGDGANTAYTGGSGGNTDNGDGSGGANQFILETKLNPNALRNHRQSWRELK